MESDVSHRTTAVDRIIGRNLRTYRHARQLTQMQLSTALSISYQQIQKYEKGRNRISAATLLELSQILEVPLIDFYKDINTTDPANPLDPELLTRDNLEFLRVFALLSPAERKVFYQVTLRATSLRKPATQTSSPNDSNFCKNLS